MQTTFMYVPLRGIIQPWLPLLPHNCNTVTLAVRGNTATLLTYILLSLQGRNSCQQIIHLDKNSSLQESGR